MLVLEKSIGGVIVFFFFFFFESLENDPIIRYAFNEVCGNKLQCDGYCDLNNYIYGRIDKDEIKQSLEKAQSPFAKLYQKSYPTFETAPELWRQFTEKDLPQNNSKELKTIESIAVMNWYYQSFRTWKEREEFTIDLVKKIRNLYAYQGRLGFEKGFVFDKSFVELVFISSINRFYSEISSLVNPKFDLYFRGHSNVNYTLVPSIMRKKEWRMNERRMYNDLLINCPQDFEGAKSHLQYLVQMQHYGLPTRLIDITRNPLVALFFSCQKLSPNNGEVIIFGVDRSAVKYPQSDMVSILASIPLFDNDIQMQIHDFATDTSLAKLDFNKKVARLLHEIRTEKPAFQGEIDKEDLLRSVIVQPLKDNSRILKQDGAFILCGLARDCVNLKVNDLRYKERSGKYRVFIVTDKEKILSQLDAFSINRATLFPEIDEVAEYIRNKY